MKNPQLLAKGKCGFFINESTLTSNIYLIDFRFEDDKVSYFTLPLRFCIISL